MAAAVVAAGVGTPAPLAPVAAAAELAPADVAGDTPQATISEDVPPLTDESPYWRHAVAGAGDHVKELAAWSPSMERTVPLAVILAEPGAPTLYLLNGADGGEGGANWIQQSNVLDFYADKNVNVVIPMAGAFSYYTDWLEEIPELGGKQRWETFLTKELPGPVEEYLGAGPERGIAGMSMSATSSLLLAQHNPGFYDAVGSFSGCASTTAPVPRLYAAITVARGGGTVDQMWGPADTAHARHHDALLNAGKLRGTELYISNGSGLAGHWDMPSSPRLDDFDEAQISNAVATTVGVGGLIEAATNTCTHDLRAKLDSLDIPADYNFTPTGTHSWGYWEDALVDSWPTFARAFGRQG
ncbi:hypothetical protein A605_01880 [Corynebacterium halotolerans YIM 70093 = DSM 44683]|uniref:Esterase n=1 Tax=Corynebacterium halotolerans YIM 70093 = DSM 44683 TaxID=1121362 RepID=M1NV64_9CORY|nr:hypothetical protein A605_01880 [Corynebacterium halotolerans YIM 70093 = DSM 44683]